MSDTRKLNGARSRRRRRRGHGLREALTRPGGAHGVTIEPLAWREVRPSRCRWAASRRRTRSRARSGDGSAKVRAARAPAQACHGSVAGSRRAHDAPPPPPPRLHAQLTTPACASSAASVRPGGGATTSRDVPEALELLYHHQRVGPGASTPSCRRCAGCTGCASMLPKTAADGAAGGRGGWAVGGLVVLERRRAGVGSTAGAGWGRARAGGERGGRGEVGRASASRGGVTARRTVKRCETVLYVCCDGSYVSREA